MKSLTACFAFWLTLAGVYSYSATLNPPRHIVVIIFENKEYSSIIGNSHAPYINSLANSYALATQYYARHHPSLPNYLEFVAGSNMGVTDDKEGHVLSGQFLGRQLHEAGYSSALYAESLPGWETSQRPCKYQSQDKYVKRHNPFAFWDWVEGLNGVSNHCGMVKTMGAFKPDRLKGLTVIIPNICNDMHNCGISTGDQWLKNHAPTILNHMHSGDFLVVTWDEGSTDKYGGGHVATIFAGPRSKKHFKDGHFYTTDSLLRTIENIFRVPCLRNACKASGMANMLQ